MAVKTVEIPEIGMVTLYKRRGNRSLRLSLSANGEVRVSLPSWVPYKAGEEFARAKAAWILANRRQPSADLRHGQMIGKAHKMHFAPSSMATKITSRLRQNQIEITHPSSFEDLHPDIQKAARAAAIRALRKEAEALLPERLSSLSQQTGYTYSSVKIKQLKSRWGSCNSEREITLNLFLMQLPWHLIDYVLVHELVHTKVMRHGPPFWREMERHVPYAKRLRKEIANYHPVLGG